MATIVIPYKPRYPHVHDVLESKRFVVLVAHRRFGKTVLSVNHLLKSALTCTKEHGSFAYVAPFRNQGKEIAWAYLKHFSSVIPGRAVNEGDLSITLPNGARVRIFGADNPDALRGLYFDGICLDEVAQMKREVWQEIVRPALADRLGWALFIGTPKGENLFHELYVEAVKRSRDADSQWAALTFRVSDTDALPASEVADAKAGMSDNAFRQEFLCDFSASSDDVLITLDEAQAAADRDYAPEIYASMPLVFGVDVARFGDDSTCIVMRRGLKAFPAVKIHHKDSVEVAQRIISLYHQHQPQDIFVDAGQGQGVIDVLRRALPCVNEVPFGGQALDPARYFNRRSEMWYLMREWIKDGGAIDNDPQLVGELAAPTYEFTTQGKIALEKKDDIKERLGRSPDVADALALTFALPVLPELGRRQEYADMQRNIFASYNEDLGDQYASGIQAPLI